MAEQQPPLLALHDYAQGVEAVSRRLESLADAFDRVGNRDVANELIQASVDLDALSRKVREAASDELRSKAQEAQRGLTQVVEGVLAGIALSAAKDGEATT